MPVHIRNGKGYGGVPPAEQIEYSNTTLSGIGNSIKSALDRIISLLKKSRCVELTWQEYQDGLADGTITETDDINYFITDMDLSKENSYTISHKDSTVGNMLDTHSDEIANLKTWKLITNQEINGVNTSYPIGDISKYTDICIVALINASIRGAIEIPNSVFMQGLDIYITCNNGSNAYAITYIKKNADNTFSCIGGGQVNYIRIYGR